MKLQAVKDYLNGEGSYETLKEKYKLRSSTQLKNWVMWYNGHKEFKERSSAKGEIFMTKGRKTTQEELINAIENYILFYNTKRYQLKLKCMTPMEYHTTAAA